MGMLAKSIFCHARYSPILTASALRWKKTQLAAAPETNCQGLFNQIYKKFTSYGLHHEAYA